MKDRQARDHDPCFWPWCWELTSQKRSRTANLSLVLPFRGRQLAGHRFISVKMRNCCGGPKGRGERTPENNNCLSKYPTYSSQPSYQRFPSLISILKADIKLWKMFKMWHPFGNFPGSCTNMFLKTACRSFIWISCTFFPWLFFCTEELTRFYPLKDKVPLKSPP